MGSRRTSGLFLGIDGGGTGCRARIEDADGTVLGTGLAGPATTRLGLDGAWAALKTACDGAIAEAGIDDAEIAAMRAGAGVAGYNRHGAPAAFAAMAHPFASFAFATDGFTACLGAHRGGDGGIVVVGTGSCGIGLIEGRMVKIGGYGFPISDEGSGADLGLHAIRQALRAHDGRERPSALTREVMARFEDPGAAIAWMDRATATDYATFAPLVVRHADQGDPIGRRIVQAAAGHIDGIVRALAAAGAPRISVIGGLASAITPWLAADARRGLQDPLADAVSGAIILARTTDPYQRSTGRTV